MLENNFDFKVKRHKLAFVVTTDDEKTIYDDEKDSQINNLS